MTQVRDAIIASAGTILMIGGGILTSGGNIWEGLAAIIVGVGCYIVYEKI